MSRVKYPDNVIRARRQSIEVAENLGIWADEDGFIGVWCADMCALRADLYAGRRHG